VAARPFQHPEFLLLLAVLALAPFATLPRAVHSKDAPRVVVYPTRTMGTYANIALVTADSAASAPVARIAQSAFYRVDSLMSNWTTTSEVARLNREAVRGTTVHPEVAAVIDSSLHLWRESDHAFDITVEPLVRLWGFIGGHRRVPADSEVAAAFRHVGAQRVHFDRSTRQLRFETDSMKIDLGGIAKGYAVDVAAESLKSHGVTNALVDLTGNMVAIGHPPGAPAWRIGIRDPHDRIRFFARIPLSDGDAISTSGQYEQFVPANGKKFGHILDPRTGRPVEGLLSVTVVSRSALTCDSWDTPLFVLGPEAARRKAKALTTIGAVLVQPGTAGVDTVWVEESLRDRFALEPQARAWFHVFYF